MEEVWNDINLASLNDHQTPSNSDSRNVIFQDFLARSPFHPPSSDHSFYGPSPSPPPPPLLTALSLGSTGPDFPFDLLANKPPPQTHFDALPCASLVFPCIGNKRQLGVAECHHNSTNTSSGNAYTNELEQKVDLLSKENERLRKQQEEWCKASGTHKKKNALYRTSTAPF
ncbi:protein FD-like [Senna tora]|uniref:Protein FD-like n=1 Tax=Senna tora TaxID=362788 RepID=A0A834TUW6_9FABA|nr:protein FD-like [Senna tora]